MLTHQKTLFPSSILFFFSGPSNGPSPDEKKDSNQDIQLELLELTIPTSKVTRARSKVRKLHRALYSKLTPLCRPLLFSLRKKKKITGEPSKVFHTLKHSIVSVSTYLSVCEPLSSLSFFLILQSITPSVQLFHFVFSSLSVFYFLFSLISSSFMYLTISGFPSCLGSLCPKIVSMDTVR